MPKEGTFLVTEADGETAVLRDVADGQVHTLATNPGVEAGEVLDATVRAEPPMEVTWELDGVESRRTIELLETDLQPTQRARQVAGDQDQGDVERIERAGTGEVHVLSVPDPAAAAADVLDDEETVARAARLGAVRVEVRTGEGMVSVRYLPD